MPDVTKKILSTTMLSQADMEMAYANGIEITCIPFITIQQLPESEIQQQLPEMTDDDVFVFTSKHAVAAIEPLINGFQNNTYCIAGATLQAVTAAGLQVIATAGDAQLLIQKIQIGPLTRYIFFCGNLRMNTIPDFFKGKKASFYEVVCYKNTLSPKMITEHFDGVMFFSPSGAESYFSANVVQQHQKYYCIGTTTAAAVQQFAKVNIIVADAPNAASIIKKIV